MKSNNRKGDKDIATKSKIRKGDKVVAISGNDRGQIGVVLSRSNDKVVVQGVNVRKKHVKKSSLYPHGSIIDLEKPIHISNIKLCVDNDKPVKLKVRNADDGQRQLVYKDGDNEIVYRSL